MSFNYLKIWKTNLAEIYSKIVDLNISYANLLENCFM